MKQNVGSLKTKTDTREQGSRDGGQKKKERSEEGSEGKWEGKRERRAQRQRTNQQSQGKVGGIITEPTASNTLGNVESHDNVVPESLPYPISPIDKEIMDWCQYVN